MRRGSTGPGQAGAACVSVPVPDEDAVGSVNAPAGWYPDPVGGVGLRWWDGRLWTEYTHHPMRSG